MGYTTTFKGEFRLNQPLPESAARAHKEFCEHQHKEDEGTGCPGGYCQWKLSEDRMSFKWDGEEKFYDYDEWLTYLIRNVVERNGLVLNGSVEWFGEESDDIGVLTCENNVVTAKLKEFVQVFKDYDNKVEKIECEGWMTECGWFIPGFQQPDERCCGKHKWIRAKSIMSVKKDE